MKKIYFMRMFLVVVLGSIATFIHAQSVEELLPLDGLNYFVDRDGSDDWEGYKVSYDVTTQTVTYAYPEGQMGYGWAGWGFNNIVGGDGPVDFSAFSAITIYIEPEFAVGKDSPLEFAIRYSALDSDNKYGAYVIGSATITPTTITIPLDAEFRNEVDYIYLKSGNSGKIKINKITASYDGQMDLPFEEFHTAWKDGGDVPSHYEYYEALGFGGIIFSGNDRWIAWGYGNDGRKYGEYDYLRIDFADPSAAEITLDISYNPENVYSKSVVMVPVGAEFIVLALNKDVPNEYERTDAGQEGNLGGGVRDIIIRSSNHEILYVTRAYLAKGEIPDLPIVPLPDLVVTGIGWTPAIPQDGDQIQFFAKVKNIGTAASPNDKKHGLGFYATGADGEELNIGWSEHRKPEVTTEVSIAPGEEVILTMNGGPFGTDTWLYQAASGPYFIRALINDTQDFPEADGYSNNWSDYVEFGDYVSINAPVNKGTVSGNNGVIRITGYPSNASLILYNLLGQVVLKRNLQPDSSINVPSGIYILDIQSNGYRYVHKVIVK
ncbi:MAG: T9SS type A sorting domain-containing protein [Candidatus Symbiothrix sp.]|nr:T9SS type A sorting domain-containing protein [Candidatus Symbiothrix sp.]